MRNLCLLLALFFATILQAQNPAAIDLSFSFKDHFTMINNPASLLLLQPNGKIIVIGSFTKSVKYRNQENDFVQMLRLNSDLTLDETFNSGTGFNAVPKALALQADGKILVGGNISTYNGITGIQKILRLNIDGTFDPTFVNTSIPVNGDVNCIKVQSDNKILVGGNFINGTRSMLIRLSTDGSLDTSFTLASSAIYSDGYITTVDQLPNGKILAGGKYSSTMTNKLILLNTNGTIDPSFNFSLLGNIITHVIIQPDTKILVTTSNIGLGNDKLLRLNSNGSEDSSLNLGTGLYSTSTIQLNKPMLQSNGDIILYGNMESYDGNVVNGRVRIHSNGAFDNTYNYESNMLSVTNPILQPDGNIFGFYDAGLNSNFTEMYAFIRLNPNGFILDNQQLNTTTEVGKIYKKPNGDILTVGYSLFHIFYHNIKLMDENGNLIFNSNLKYPTYSADNSLNLMQPDGKLLYISPGNELFGGGIKRMNEDYSFDTSLTTNFQDSPTAIGLQPDGQILMTNVLVDLSSNHYAQVRRYESNGASNSLSFNLGIGTNAWGEINKIVVQPDGKILIAGKFTMYNGVARQNLARLNANGTVDTSFVMPLVNSTEIYEIVLQADGKILLSDRDLGLFRLHGTDGNFDSFFSGAPNLTNVRTIALQADGKILVGGWFQFNGSYGIARLNSNGSLDNSFDAGVGFDAGVNSILVEPNGKILVGGSFSKYNGTYCNGLIRLVGGDGFLIQGQIKFDSDNNGCNTSDIDYPHMKFIITSGLINNSLITDTSGNYSFTVAPGTYTVTPEISNFFTINPVNFTVTFPSAASPFVQDFCLTSNSNHPDLEISILPLNVARPGFDSKYKIIYKNKGNQLHSGSVTLNFNDAVIDLVTATPGASSQTTNNLSWNYTNLLPLEKREVLLTFNLNTPTETPPLNSGSILNYTAIITSSLLDETPNDNTFTFNQNVVNSFDPNDKTCLEGATIGASQVGDYVHYLIRFENKGTYNAQNISVRDLIDTAKFDINTLTPISGSHLFVTRITEGNKVEFYFEDINLPFADATNDGYVAFKIKTRATLVGGDTFSNSAAIYFDYNSAIDTNTATTTIQALAVQDFAFGQYFTVYPNPANNQLNIDKKENIEISSLSIFNTLGQLIITIPNAQKTSAVDVSCLKSGNYFLRINSDQGISNAKFIKF